MNILEKAIDKFGIDNQCHKAIEECVELANAVSNIRKNNTEQNRVDLIGEIADVQIMIEQLKIIYSIKTNEVEDVVKFKTNRLKNLL